MCFADESTHARSHYSQALTVAGSVPNDFQEVKHNFQLDWYMTHNAIKTVKQNTVVLEQQNNSRNIWNFTS